MGKSNAEEYLNRAEKKASSSVGWFGSSSNKWEEAGDLFAQVSTVKDSNSSLSNSLFSFEVQALGVDSR